MQKKKSGVKKCLEILPLRGGGEVGPLMANAILNFHFDFLTTSLMLAVENLTTFTSCGLYTLDSLAMVAEGLHFV